MIPLLDLEAPIVPGRGLGGIRVGAKIKRYGDLLFEAHQQYDEEDGGPEWCGFHYAPWSLVYRLGQVYGQTDDEFVAMAEAVGRGDWEGAAQAMEPPGEPFDPAVEIYVDVRNARIYMLRALAAYAGTLGGVRAGMSFGEARAVEPRLRYDEGADDVWLGDDERVGLTLSESDPPPEVVPELVIEAIEVYAPKLTTRGAIAL